MVDDQHRCELEEAVQRHEVRDVATDTAAYVSEGDVFWQGLGQITLLSQDDEANVPPGEVVWKN